MAKIDTDKFIDLDKIFETIENAQKSLENAVGELQDAESAAWGSGWMKNIHGILERAEKLESDIETLAGKVENFKCDANFDIDSVNPDYLQKKI